MLGCIQPMSSPMMKRMFGFRSWAAAGALAAVMAASEARQPSQAPLVMLIVGTSLAAARDGPAALCPLAFAARVRAATRLWRRQRRHETVHRGIGASSARNVDQGFGLPHAKG